MNMVTYFALGISLSVVIWCVQRPNWNFAMKALCCLLAGLTATVLVFFEISPNTLGKESWYNRGPVPSIFFFTLMLLGMIARYFTKAIEARREKIAALEKAGSEFHKPPITLDLWELSYPLFVSVVTFGALLAQMKDNSLSLANVVLSFQTGFFWQTILSSKQEKVGA